MTIDGIVVRADAEAVVIVSAQPLRLLSSAVHRGGSVSARAVVNLHVGKDDAATCEGNVLTLRRAF